MKKIWKWLKNSNETIGVIILIIALWYLVPPVLKWIDPQAGEFGIEILYVPFIAIIFCLLGLLFVWVYLRIAFPKGRDTLDELFENENLSQWEKSQFILRLFGYLVALYAVSLLAVTGISYIM